MNDEHYGHRAGVIHTEIESRTAKKKELEKEKQNVLEKLEKARSNVRPRESKRTPPNKQKEPER